MKYLDALLDGTWKEGKKHSDTKENELTELTPCATNTPKRGLSVMSVRNPMNIEKQKPIEALDDYWKEEILPRLSRLHMAGRLPDLATCPVWNEVDRLWQVSSPDVEKVKTAMTKAVEVYDKSGSFFNEK